MHLKPQIQSLIGLVVAICALVPRPAAALPGDRDDPAAGPHEIFEVRRGSGTYWFDPDGNGEHKPFRGSYDASQGGGWLLVLNYVHEGGTNPELKTRSGKLPLLGASLLGVDESGTGHWGHAVPGLLELFHVSELRFYGVTSHHERVVHFATDYPAALEYATTGQGRMIRGTDNPTGVNTQHVLLRGHSASIPAGASHGRVDQGVAALTEFPFWQGDCCTWGVRGALGQSDEQVRWEVDDSLNDDPPGYQHDTIHRVWIRTASLCSNGIVEPEEACDDENADPEDGCSTTCQVEDGYYCRGEPSGCAINVCGDAFVAGSEGCDDGNTESSDGCSQSCGVEHGFICGDEPSACASECGDGTVARDEACDDANAEDGDGCSALCQLEAGSDCRGEPSECVAECNDGGSCSQKEQPSASGCTLNLPWSGQGRGTVAFFVIALMLVLRRFDARSRARALSIAIFFGALAAAQPAGALPGDENDPAAGPHEIFEARRGSGTYWFDPDGTTGPIEPFIGRYDAAEGGGWLMILNYVHQGGANPDLNARQVDVPLIGSSSLGADESGGEFWGHATPALLTAFQIEEARFFGRTSAHPRVVHFSVNARYLLDYIQTGEGPFDNPVAAGVPLAGHTGIILESLLVGAGNSGDYALTNLLFFGVDPTSAALLAWNVGGTSGLAEGLWSVDDLDFANPDGHDTIHRTWIRTAALCGNGHVETVEECDDAGLADGDGCSSACEAEFDFVCRGEPSVCIVNTCGDGLVAGTDRCDDGNNESGDGCNRECQTEHGFFCAGAPSVCESECSDGLVARDEACDDGNEDNGDGCDAKCVQEADFICGGEPSVCLFCTGPPEECEQKSDPDASGCSMTPGARSNFPSGVVVILLLVFLVRRRLGPCTS